MKNRPRMLSATFVRNVNLPGRYGDGRGGLGLSLLVKPASRGGFSKSWSQSVRLCGRPTSIAQHIADKINEFIRADVPAPADRAA